MAQPIALELPHRDPREELRARLENAPIEHAEAVLSGYELLQGLHDRGVLELLRAAVGSGDKLVETAVEAARTPEAIRGMRNVLILAKMMGSIEPELLKSFAGAFPEALKGAGLQGAQPPGLWSLLKGFRSKDGRRGLGVVNSLLEAWGRNMAAQNRRPQD